MRVTMIGTFGMRPKMTMSRRALPLARALVSRGHHVTVIVPPWDWPEDAGQRLLVDDVDVINTALPARTPGLWYVRLTNTLVQQTLASRPDVVHAFKPKGFSGMALAALLAMKQIGQMRARLVLDTDDWEGSGGWNDVNPYPRWQRLLFSAQEEGLLRAAAAVTVASRELARLAAIRRGGRGVYYLPNGVADKGGSQPAAADADAVRRQLAERHAFDPDKPLLLLYTRFVEYRIDHLLNIVRAIGERLPHATLLVVGTGLLGQERQLEQAAQFGNFALRIVLAGWIPEAGLGSYFAAADVALFPMEDTRLNRTKCPMKLVDLLAAGVPVVAEGVGQVNEYIESGVSGVTVAAGDVDTFAEAVLRLVRSPDERTRLGQGARARMNQHFRWETLAATAEWAYRGQRP